MTLTHKSRLGFCALLCSSLIGSALGAGCSPDPRPAPSAARDMTQVTTPPLRPTPMIEPSLETQADYDALESRLLRRMGLPDLIAVYTKLSEGRTTITEERDALLFQRLALLHLQVGTREGGFQEAFAIADRLRRDMPGSAHTEYLIGAITALLMPTAPDGTYTVSPRREDVARRLVEHWDRLLQLSPDYVGPNQRGTAEIRRDKEALEAALKGSEARKESEAQDPRRATETAVPVEEPGTEGVVSDSKSPAAPPNPEPSVTKASDADLATAQQALHRLDRGDTMARRVLCRDRRERPLRPSPATSDVVRLVELKCALELDDSRRARQWLLSLVESGGVQEPCRWAGRISGSDLAFNEALSKALASRGLPDCTAP